MPSCASGAGCCCAPSSCAPVGPHRWGLPARRWGRSSFLGSGRALRARGALHAGPSLPRRLHRWRRSLLGFRSHLPCNSSPSHPSRAGCASSLDSVAPCVHESSRFAVCRPGSPRTFARVRLAGDPSRRPAAPVSRCARWPRPEGHSSVRRLPVRPAGPASATRRSNGHSQPPRCEPLAPSEPSKRNTHPLPRRASSRG